MAYTDKGKVQNYLLVDIDNTFDTQISEWANAVTAYINNYTGRVWTTTVAGVRYFDGKGGREMVLDEFTSLSEVKTLLQDLSDDQTLTADTDYVVYPYNTLPKFKIVLLPEASIASFPVGSKRVKVTGTWGLATVPDDITVAATMLLAGIIEKGLKGGTVQSESLGDYSVTFASIDSLERNMDIKKILDNYKSFEL